MPGYTIEKILGRGGMGAVYRGVQTNLDRPVAIKILPPGVEKEDPSFAERFKSEAKLMAKLNHPAVVAVYDFGTTLGGQLYFAMEYVDGSDVSQMIAAQGRLPPDHALAITAHVCDALAAAHELGIVHRDIKPANVLLNMKGQVKVADFGLAKVEEPGQHGLTKTGYAMGTPDFVAPEALMLGTAIDGRADIYAVGVMLYQMLTGNIPRGAFKPASVLVPGLDPRFDPIILKAMQHDRAERHQDAAELRRELDVIMTVPLVQHDAPVSAAIPVAQIAQAPGQRSAAQRPQQNRPEGSAGTPARSSPNGSVAAKNHEAGKSARAPLFIGLAAAAAIGIGAFVMLSGGKKEAQPKWSAQSSVRSDETPPAPKPAQGTERTTLPASPPKTAPKPTPSASAASKPSEPQFPPGKWVKVFTKTEDLPAQFQKAGSGVRLKDGILEVDSISTYLGLALASGNMSNCAVRATMFADSLNLSMRGEVAGKVSYLFKTTSIEVGRPATDGRPADFPRLASFSAPPKTEQQWEFGAFRNSLITRRGGEIIGFATDARIKSGIPVLANFQGTLRDIEVINLDGLSEAEALKILGVDEKGNDLRGAAVAGRAAGPPAAASAPAMSKEGNAPATPGAALGGPSALPSATTPAPVTKDDLTNSLGMKFVPVPGTDVLFCIHETRYKDYTAYAAENPGVDGTWTNQAHDGHAFTERKEEHPVVKVSWEDAQKFCEWLSKKEGRTYRLPTDQEWSHAVGVGQDEKWTKDSTPATVTPSMTDFPWGGGWPPPKGSGNYSDDSRKARTQNANAQYLKNYDDAFPTTAPVMSFTPNKLGLYDLEGNVREWVEDWYDNAQADRVLRGGCWGSYGRGTLLSSFRSHMPPGNRHYYDGFRIVLEPEFSSKSAVVPMPATTQPVAPVVPATPGATSPSPAAKLPPELAALHEQFVQLQAERVTAPFEAEVAKLNAGYLGGIDREIANEKKAGHLDGVIALEAEKKLIQGVTASQPSSSDHRRQDAVAPCPIPAEDDEKTVEALKKLRGIYRDAYAKIEAARAANLKGLTDPLIVRLKQLVADLTRQDRVADAKSVREYREAVEKGDKGDAGETAQPVADEAVAKMTEEAPAATSQLPAGVLKAAGVFQDKPLDLSSFGDLSGFIQVTCGNASWAALRADGSVISSNPAINGLKDIESVNYTNQGLAAIPRKKSASIMVTGPSPTTAKGIEPSDYGGGKVVDVACAGQANLIVLKDDHSIRLIGPNFPVNKTLQETKALPDIVAVSSCSKVLLALDQSGRVHAWTWWSPDDKSNDLPAYSLDTATVPPDVVAIMGLSQRNFLAVTKSGVWEELEWKPGKACQRTRSGSMPPNWSRIRAPHLGAAIDSDGSWMSLRPVTGSVAPLLPKDCKVLDVTAFWDVNSSCVLWIEPPGAGTPPETATPSPATTAAKSDFTNSLGMKFLPVKGTEVMFCIHETRRQDYAAYANEVSGVNGLWKSATRDGVPSGDKDDHPVVGVSWDHAAAFCAWLSKKEGKTYRLPTDREWSYAVGIGRDERWTKTTTPESLKGQAKEFPWDGDYPPETKDLAGNYGDSAWHEKFPTQPWLENYSDGYPTTAPVMSFKPNSFGLYDMGGNVREWVEDWWNDAQADKVMRGTFFGHFTRDSLLSSFRDHTAPNRLDANSGFRVVVEVK